MSLITVIKAGGADTNIMNANLTADDDRNQDMNGKVMSFTNGKQFKWLNNVAPTIGEGSFDFSAYGSTSSDILWRLKNGTGSVKAKVLGDGSTEWLTGFHSFGDTINTQAKLQGVTNAVGVVAVRGYHYGVGGTAGTFSADGVNARGVAGTALGFGGEGVRGDGYYGLSGASATGWALFLEPYGGNTNAAWMKGLVKTVSPSSSVLDTAFTIRNNTDTADLAVIRGNGRAEFYGDIYARNEKIFLQDLYSIYFNHNALSIASGLTYNSRGEIGVNYVSHNFKTDSLITTAGSRLFAVNNYTTLHWQINKDGVINAPTMPTYADNAAALVGGLVVGDEYKTATGERRIVV